MSNILDGPGSTPQETTIELIKLHRQISAVYADMSVDDDTANNLGERGVIGLAHPACESCPYP